MTETLRQKQSRFVTMVVKLLDHAHSQGYSITFGETYRSPEEAERLAKLGKGIRNSLHTQRLAIDLNLFVDGKYMSSTKAHETLGKYWESIGGTWGGRFGDGNHYSIEHGGKK